MPHETVDPQVGGGDSSYFGFHGWTAASGFAGVGVRELSFHFEISTAAKPRVDSVTVLFELVKEERSCTAATTHHLNKNPVDGG